MRRKFSLIRFFSERRSSPAIWLTIYSDLMTNLMLFFLMLWGLTRMPLEAYTIAADSFKSTIMKEMAKPLPKKKKEEPVIPGNFDKIVKAKSDLQGIRVIFDSPVLFDLGSAKLKEEAMTPLNEIVKYLSDVDYKVIVEGHTDNIPIKRGLRYSSNWELSLDRARSVIKFFQKKGIDSERLILAGYGEHHPLYPNDTPEHRMLNRRIEINIIYWED
ncbi:MAG: flagellar motor protein MotB [Elusimicrobia bacterium]|nr:flagellar motor protein MotB [Elusimicrobiota bacterium]